MSDFKKRRDDVVLALFANIERAQINNLIDEIGLGKKLQTLEKENAELKEKNANLQKLNDQLTKDKNPLKKYIRDDKKEKGLVGGLSSHR